MPTIQEIVEDYRQQQDRLINDCFMLALEGATAGEERLQGALSKGARANTDPATQEKVFMAEAQDAARELRDSRREKYVELDAELRAAVEARVEEIEEILSPKSASFSDLAAAGTASEDALISAMDLALDGGNRDAALVALAAARQRGLDAVLSHAHTVDEEWDELLTELYDADAVPDYDPGERFEQFAADPEPGQFLVERQKAINTYSQMSG